MPGKTRQQIQDLAEHRGQVANDVNVQAPIGGWNTRDAFDDLPPTDALQMDNWLPALGAVKVREGRSVHSTGVGPQLILNPEFDDIGAEPPAAENWPEQSTDANNRIFRSNISPYSGTWSLHITNLSPPNLDQYAYQNIAVEESTEYTVSFYYRCDEGSSTYTPSNVLVENLSVPGPPIALEALPWIDSWTRYEFSFVVPAGCTSIQLQLHTELTTNAGTYYDAFFMNRAYSDGNVETLMVLEADNFNRLVSADSGAIRDITTGLPVTLDSGFTSNRWDWANFSSYLIMVNGTDVPQEWDGATFQDLTPTLVGPTNPIGCHPYKNRMYYWDSNDQSIWYTALFARAGTCTEFDLSQLTRFGGNIARMETWTHDGGSGPDDHAVFIMSSGEVIVFQGTSPSSVADWALVGIYYIGEPLGDRVTAKFGGNLIIGSELDIINMAKIMSGPEALAERSKIAGAIEEIAEFSGSSFFDLIMYPRKKLALFNVPAPGGTETYQFAQNLVTGAWARIVGWTIHSWVVFNGELYTGGSQGTVYKAFDGHTDDTVTDGVTTSVPIQSNLQTAWLTFGSHLNKTFHAIKPFIRTTGVQPINLETTVDYGILPALDFPAPINVGGTPWGPAVGGISPWGSPWGTQSGVMQTWQIVTGYGRVVSMEMKMQTDVETVFASSLWHIEAGTAM